MQRVLGPFSQQYPLCSSTSAFRQGWQPCLGEDTTETKATELQAKEEEFAAAKAEQTTLETTAGGQTTTSTK